jgi:hypothetical protein
VSEYELDEFGGEPEPVEPFLAEATDVSLLETESEAPRSRHPVTDKFFDEQGRPRDVVELRSPAALAEVWRQQDAELARAQGPAVDSTQLPQPPQSWEADEFDRVAQNEAQIAASARAYEQTLYADVERLGAEARFGVTDPEQLRAVAQGVESWRRAWFDNELVRGASVQQALGGLEQLGSLGYVQQVAEQLLEQARVDKELANTGSRRHARASWAAQVVEAELGLRPAPVPIWQKYPGLQRQWNAMQARSERLAAQREAMDQIKQASRARSAALHPAADAHWRATNTRKLSN